MMKKIFQTRTSKDDGNCAQAVIATLFGLELDDVPDFVRSHHIKPMAAEIARFHRDRGFQAIYAYKNTNAYLRQKTLLETAKSYDGVNGLFYAVVRSKTFDGSLHAVVVDRGLNIVHDPNPNGRCLELGAEDVIQLLATRYYR